MAISTLTGAESGLIYPNVFSKAAGTQGSAGVLRSFFAMSGFPPAGTVGSPGLAGTALSGPVTGQIPYTNPVSGNTYVGAMRGAYMSNTASTQASGTLILADRLWHNSGLVVSITTSQTIGSVTWPARDNNASINGEGVYIGMEVTTAMGAGAPGCQINYTNSSGTSGRLGTPVNAITASAPVGLFWVFGLQDGDTGVKSVQAFSQTSSSASGAISLVAFRPITFLVAPRGFDSGKVDAITGGFGRVYDSSVPFFLSMTVSTLQEFWAGEVNFSQG